MFLKEICYTFLIYFFEIEKIARKLTEKWKFYLKSIKIWKIKGNQKLKS